MVARLSLAAAAATVLLAGCGGNAQPAAESSATPATTVTPAATSGATPSPTEQGPTARFEVAAGKVVSGPRTVEVATGDRVVIEVLTDKADELHVHGYDKEIDVDAGRPGRIAFTADIPGVFEVELHSGVRLCDLRVR
jgi:hypothetical protein